MKAPRFPEADRRRGHLLAPAALLSALPPVGSTEGRLRTATVHGKFFSVITGWTWYVLEGQAEATIFAEDDWILWGLVVGHEAEFGSFSLTEIGGQARPLPVERDLYWAPAPLAAVIEGPEWRGTPAQRARLLDVLGVPA